MTLPEDYVVNKFYQFAGGPRRNRYTNTYQGSCPMCREGNSWLKKQRFFFIPKKNLIYCHNCGYSANPVKWVLDVTGSSLEEILKETGELVVDIYSNTEEIVKIESETLPKDCINLLDTSQTDFYKNNKTIKAALDFIEKRYLLNDINRPKELFISLVDRIHKNRLVLPFYDDNDKIIYYQTRTILETDNLYKPRYMSKLGA